MRRSFTHEQPAGYRNCTTHNAVEYKRGREWYRSVARQFRVFQVAKSEHDRVRSTFRALKQTRFIRRTPCSEAVPTFSPASPLNVFIWLEHASVSLRGKNQRNAKIPGPTDLRRRATQNDVAATNGFNSPAFCYSVSRGTRFSHHFVLVSVPNLTSALPENNRPRWTRKYTA